MTGQRLSEEARAEIAARLVRFRQSTPSLRYAVYNYTDDIAALLNHAQWADERIRELEDALKRLHKYALSRAKAQITGYDEHDGAIVQAGEVLERIR